MRKKGPTKAKMKEIDPQKTFCSANIKKAPRSYESLNPALHLPKLLTFSNTSNLKTLRLCKIMTSFMTDPDDDLVFTFAAIVIPSLTNTSYPSFCQTVSLELSNFVR
jgi:hypothetical protein